MSHVQKLFCILCLVIVAGLHTGCGKTTTNASQDILQNTISLDQTSTSPPMLTATTVASTPPSENLPETSISIDGNSDDWRNRVAFDIDPKGDSVDGSFDLTNGFAFVNAHAFYLLVEADDSTKPILMFDMFFEIDDRSFQITWSPGDEIVRLREWLDGNPLDFQLALNSRIAFDEALEARFDLDDLGNPNRVRVEGISVIVESAEDAIVSDSWRPSGTPPAINEVDPEHVHSNEEPYFLARRFGLPEGYVAESIVEPPGYFQTFARSQDGTIFFQSRRFDVEPYIGVLNPITGEQTSLLDLPVGKVPYEIIGGPGDTVMIQVEDEIWQISTDGSYEIWGQAPNAVALHYAPDGRLLGTTLGNGTTLIEILKDGSHNIIANDFESVFSATARSDGTIAVYDDGTGSIYRIDLDGSKHGLVLNTLPGENRLLWLNHEETLFTGWGDDVIKIDWSTGAQTAYSFREILTCIGHFSAAFQFYDPDNTSRLLTAGDQFGWWDIETGETSLFHFRGVFTPAADIGPDGDLYLGTPACGDEYPGKVLHVTPDGDSQVTIDNLPGRVWDIAFDAEGGLYLASGLTNTPKRLFYKSIESDVLLEIPDAPTDFESLVINPNSGHLLVSHTSGGAVIMEFDESGLIETKPIDIPYGQEELGQFRLATSPDGTLFAYAAANWSTSKPYLWILRIDLETGSSEIVAEILRETPGGGMASIDIDENGHIWLLVSPDSILYRVTSDGEIIKFAQQLPIDTPGVAVNGKTGDIYFTHNSGIFRIYREP